MLESIVEESHRLTRLIDNLLDMTRLEAGAVALNRQWHVLEELIGSARNHVGGRLSGHEVRVDLPADMPLILVDGSLFEQALTNLLENAVRYTPAGSRIEIAATKAGDQVEIRISDNGPGLPAGMENRVFEKFFQGDRRAPDSRRGVGLGLAICKGIVEAHGGTIVARNRPQGGAEFTIRLPANNEQPQVPKNMV
jgi:two-component system sensor histidine kinase KdpD